MRHAINRACVGIIVSILLVSSFLPLSAHAETNHAPVITSVPPTTVIAGTVVTYQVTASDPEANPVTYSLRASFQGMAISASGIFSWRPTLAGPYNAVIAVTDSFGNATLQNLSLIVSPATPITLVVVPQEAARNAGESISYSAKASDQFGNMVDVTAASSAIIPAGAGGTLSGMTYTTQSSGNWNVSFAYQSLTATAKLFVSPSQATSLTTSPIATEVTAGEELPIQASLHDNQGNSWDATSAITVTSNDTQAKINGTTYIGTKKGNWKVTAQINGIGAHADVAVTPADPANISIQPSDALMSLRVGEKKQFSILITDIYGNAIDDLPISWSIRPDIGTITADGLLTAGAPGSATLIALAGPLTAEKTVSFIPGSSSGTTTNSSDTGTVKGESEENTQEQISAAPENTATDTEKKCSAPDWWLAGLIYIGYILILCGYYLAIRKESDKTWWIFPVLLSVIGIIIYIKYFCGSYPWWPWVLILIGIGVTGLMRYKKRPTSTNTPEQKPLF